MGENILNMEEVDEEYKKAVYEAVTAIIYCLS